MCSASQNCSMYVIGITNLRISKEVVTGNGVTGACDGVLRPGSGAFVRSPLGATKPCPRPGHNQLPKLILGIRFTDGIEVVRSQAQAAAA
jgi:hypothetical protein